MFSTPMSAHVPVVDLPVIPKRKSVIASILLWHDPKVTAIYLASASLFFYFTPIRGDSVVSVAGIALCAYQVLGMVAVQANARLNGNLDKHL